MAIVGRHGDLRRLTRILGLATDLEPYLRPVCEALQCRRSLAAIPLRQQDSDSDSSADVVPSGQNKRTRTPYEQRDGRQRTGHRSSPDVAANQRQPGEALLNERAGRPSWGNQGFVPPATHQEIDRRAQQERSADHQSDSGRPSTSGQGRSPDGAHRWLPGVKPRPKHRWIPHDQFLRRQRLEGQKRDAEFQQRYQRRMEEAKKDASTVSEPKPDHLQHQQQLSKVLGGPSPAKPVSQPAVLSNPSPTPAVPNPTPRPRPPKPPAPPPQPVALAEEILLPDDVSLKALAKLLGITTAQGEATLTELGVSISSEQDAVSPTNAELVAMSHGRTVTFSKAVMERDHDALPRPPVVTIMGHVDHGKTSLLDALRKSSVAAGEAGGITQHIGAFQVTMPDSGGVITFLDTPGHAAFSSMRARGAAVTDLVVLVVAADDGVMPQTKEAIYHAQASGCPIVVALTKCDIPGANPDFALEQLAAEGLELETFGGSIPVVQTAAPVGIGLKDLEEALLFQAELLELKASQTRPVVGVVVEAKMTKGQGPVVTIIVKRGSLKVGQNVVVGSHWGKVRSMKSASGQALKVALPGQPVEVSGLRGMPMAGDDFLVQSSEESARLLSEARELRKEQLLVQSTAHDTASSGAKDEEDEEETVPEEKQLVVIIKADTQGSAEAIAASVAALSSEIVSVKPIQAGLGAITTSDIDSAISMGAKIVGFNVKPANGAVDSQAKQKDITVVKHNIIYHLLQEVSAWMAELAPQVEETFTAGEASIVQTFPLKEQRGQEASAVAGCRIHTGSLSRQSTFRVLRSGDEIWTGNCASIRRHKLQVEQVGKGNECGVVLEGFSGFQPGDTLQCIKTKLVPQSIENVCTVLHTGKAQSRNQKYSHAT